MVILFYIISPSKSTAQCPDFEIVAVNNGVNSVGLIEIMVILQVNESFSSNFMQIEFDILNGEFDCYTLYPSPWAHGENFELTNNVTLVRIERSEAVDLVFLENEFIHMFTMYINAAPGECFTISQDEDNTFNFDVGGSGLCHPSNSQIVITDCAASDVISGVINRPTFVPHCDNSINGGVPNVVVTSDITINNNNPYFCMDDFQTVTGNDGVYSLEINPDYDQSLYARSEATILCGLEQTDLDIIQEHIVGQVVFTYPWMYIAADLNRDNQITGKDMVKLRKIILGFEDPNDFEGWRFPTSASYYSVPIPILNFPIVDYEIDPANHPNNNFDFVAIKMGDLNTSCTDCVSSIQEEGPITRSENDVISGIQKGNTYFLDLDNNHLRINLEFDGDYQDRDFLVSSNIEVIKDVNFIDGKTVLTVFLMNYKNAEDVKIKIETKAIDYTNGSIRTKNSESLKVEFKSEDLIVFPNPTSDYINFETKETVPFEIMDNRGKLLDSGETNGHILLKGILPGIYFLKIYDESEVRISRFIKI